MHLPGDIMSQLMHPPRRHFVPLSQFESPHLGQSLRVSRAYLGYILGNFWPYLWHIYKKTIVQLAFFGRQIVPSDKMSHFLPGDKMSQLMHRDVMESCWDILSVVPLCQFEGQYLGPSKCFSAPRHQMWPKVSLKKRVLPFSPRRQNVPLLHS